MMIVEARKSLDHAESGLLMFLLLFCLLHVILLCFKCQSKHLDTALGVKFVRFPWRFLLFYYLHLSRAASDFQIGLQSGSSTENAKVIALGLFPCSRLYLAPSIIQSSSGSLKCTSVNDLRPNLVIQSKKKVLKFSIWGFTYIYKQARTLHLTIKLDNQIYFDNGHFTRATVANPFTIVQKTTQSKWIRHSHRLHSRSHNSNPCIVYDKTITARLFYLNSLTFTKKMFRRSCQCSLFFHYRD